MVDIAAFIHLLIENPDYHLAQGLTTVAMLETEDFTLNALNTYLIANELKVGKDSYTYEHNKEWNIISVDDEGKVLLLERDIRTSDNNNNGVIDSGESYLLQPPRIKTLKLGDLSDWPEVWANTQADGFAVSKSDAKEVGFDIPKKMTRH